MKIALCVGHSRYINGKRDGGAVASDKRTNEWTFNSRVAEILKKELERSGHSSIVYDSYKGSGYTSSMIWLGQQIKVDACDLAIELHFNYYDGLNDDLGHGHEWLYWHTSVKGKKLAQCCFDAEKKIIPSVFPRRILGIKEGRGAAFLESTHCPALVGEPFFGDDDFDKVDPTRVAYVYAAGINSYAK